MTARILELEEFRSSTWRKVSAWANTELAALRINLESDAAPEKTAKLRGQIRSLVLLLALEETPPAPALEEEEPE